MLADIAAAEYPRLMQRAVGHPGIDNCVLASLILRDVLVECGYEAEVTPCFVRVSNALARECIEKCHGLPQDEADKIALEYSEKGGYYIEIGPPHDHRVLPGRWAGHLVVTVAGYMIDLTLGQATRKKRGLTLGPVALPLIDSEYALTHMQSGNGEWLASWVKNPRNLGYLGGPDTMPQRRIKIVRKMLRKIETTGVRT